MNHPPFKEGVKQVCRVNNENTTLSETLSVSRRVNVKDGVLDIPRPASTAEKVQSKAFLTLINRRIFPKDVFSIRLNIYSGNFGNMMRTLFLATHGRTPGKM